MTKIKYIALLMLLLSCNDKTINTTSGLSDLKRLNLKGDVSNFVEIRSSTWSSQLSFSENGNITREERYYPALVKSFKYENGKLSRIEHYLPLNNYSDEKRMSLYTEFKYNNKQQLIEMNDIRLPDSARFTMKFEYNSEGKLIKEEGINIFNSITYDSNGNCIKKLRYSYLGNDKKDRTLDWSKIYEYDKNKQLKNELTTYSNHPTEIINRSFLYNQRNDTVEVQISKKENISVLKFKYDYDSIGNWTKKVEYRNDTIIRELNRLVYYRSK